MFGKMINNFYYGKAGKGDFRKEDLPTNRWQLFWEMLRVRFSSLSRLSLTAAVAFLPLMLVVFSNVLTFMSGLSLHSELSDIVQKAGVVMAEGMDTAVYQQQVTDALVAAGRTADEAAYLNSFVMSEFVQAILYRTLLALVPCIAITGPVQAGMAYVTRNWARDEHAFVWADFKDAVKENWKQSLAVSVITSLVPLIVYLCWNFYGQMAALNGSNFFIVPQMVVCVLALVWFMALVYLYPMIVSYKAGIGTIIKNSLIMSIARLPYTVLARLVTLIPGVIAVLVGLYTPYGVIAVLVLSAYYLILGNGLSRFVFASITNAAFDKLINSHMEGVEINRGLSVDEDDYEAEDDESTDVQA